MVAENLQTRIDDDLWQKVVASSLAACVEMRDRFIWGESGSGQYTTKSGYVFCSNSADLLNGGDSWTWLWKLKVPNK